jgi:hypothetical protein
VQQELQAALPRSRQWQECWPQVPRVPPHSTEEQYPYLDRSTKKRTGDHPNKPHDMVALEKILFVY